MFPVLEFCWNLIKSFAYPTPTQTNDENQLHQTGSAWLGPYSHHNFKTKTDGYIYEALKTYKCKQIKVQNQFCQNNL